MRTATGFVLGLVIGASSIVLALRVGYQRGLADASPKRLLPTPVSCAPHWFKPVPQTQAEIRKRICSAF
jgi:hypothetical protein